MFQINKYESSERKLEYSLHIIETVELELGLNILNICEYDKSNAIHLKKDAALSSRYWCLHNTGVHSITIPLTELLDEFSKSVKGIFFVLYLSYYEHKLDRSFFFLYFFTRNISEEFHETPNIQGESFVEYFICTGLMNGETKPIKGFAVINFPTDLLITLLYNGEVVTQTIPDYQHTKPFITNGFISEDKPVEDQVDSYENVS